MKIFALVSDIHGNWPALRSVISDAEKIVGNSSISFISLGDVVDYGPHPNECMKWIQSDKRVIVRVCGNHDQEMNDDLTVSPKIGSDHWAFTLWTRKKILPNYRDAISKWCDCNQIENHGVEELKQFAFIHGGLESSVGHIPTQKYIRDVESARRQFRMLNGRCALIGHTHQQGFFTCRTEDDNVEMRLSVPAGYSNENEPKYLFEVSRKLDWQMLPDSNVIFNPGSVGQPRWHSIIKDYYRNIFFPPVACYMLIRVNRKKTEFAFRQVPYRHEKTIRDLYNLHWPEDADDAEIINVFTTLSRSQSHEHSIYREPVKSIKPTQSKMIEIINQKLHHAICRNLIPTLDPTWRLPEE